MSASWWDRLWTAPGSSGANNALGAQTNLLNQESALYQNVAPIAQGIAAGQLTPATQQALTNMQGNSANLYQSGLAALNKAYGGRGMGNSSFNQNAGQAMTYNLAGQQSASAQNLIQQQQLQMIMALLGMGNSAISGYGNNASGYNQMGQADLSAYTNVLGDIGKLFGPSLVK